MRPSFPFPEDLEDIRAHGARFVRCSPTHAYWGNCDRLVSLDGLHVLTVEPDEDGALLLSVESAPRSRVHGYCCPGLLHAGAEHLTERQQARLDDAIAADERPDEVWVAYQCA